MASAENSGELPEYKQGPSTSANSNGTKETGTVKKNNKHVSKFMENFNPETSARKRKKLQQKFSAPANSAKKNGAVYDENGIHIETGEDACDCLIKDCPGCFFPCVKCNSPKCGNDCRVYRKYVYEEVEFEGCNIKLKNPLFNNEK